jgi:hypothetical protein
MRPLPRRFWLLVVVVFGAIALLLTGYRAFPAVSTGHFAPLKQIFVGELSGAGATCMLVPLVVAMFRRAMANVSWLPRVASLLFGLLVYSAAHTTILALAHRFLFPLVGLAADSFGPHLAGHAAQELCHDAIAYGICAVILTMWDFASSLRERELRAVQLERALVDAQLMSLRAQLQPHFLFNALNTISSTIYDNPGAADRMLAHLARLLRAALNKSSHHEVSLREELETLAGYFALLEARFGERVQIHTEVQPDAEEVRVPSLLLQPLIENVMRHGVEVSNQPVHIELRARVLAGELALDIEDDGPGCNGRTDVLTSGIGLSSSAKRLRLLYGERARLDAGDRAEGGFGVRLRLPLRRAG